MAIATINAGVIIAYRDLRIVTDAISAGVRIGNC